MKYLADIIEDGVFSIFAADAELTAMPCDLRHWFDQSEPAHKHAVLVRATALDNLNTGCQGGGDYWSCNVIITVAGLIDVDKNLKIIEHVAGRANDILATITKSTLETATADYVVIDGVVFEGASGEASEGDMMKYDLPMLRVYFHTV